MDFLPLGRETFKRTWRLCGTDGAGNENLPRAATAWNIQMGKNTILQQHTQQLKPKSLIKTLIPKYVENSGYQYP